MKNSDRMVRTAVKEGDRVQRHPVTLYGEETILNRKPLTGRVVYVHPRKLYHVVDFGGFRETFPGVGR